MARGRCVLGVVLCAAWSVIGTAGRLEAQTAQTAQTAASAPASNACGAELLKSLAGVWKAPQYKMKRGSEIGAQVFGPNSFDVRDVDLTLDASGGGTLKIGSSVLDEKGKTWAPTAVEAKITIAPSQATQAGRCEPAVTTGGVEVRYLDDTKYQAPITGARVLLIIDPATKQIDVRFEPPNGQGAFWTTMRRQAVR